jgi:hypothetical protein
MLSTIESFLGTCRQPALLEMGEQAIALASGHYSLDLRAGRLWIEASGDEHGLSRRIVSIDRRATGVLDCTVQRFGGKTGRLSFLDLDRPQTARKSLVGVRQNFAEQFRRMLYRQIPGWEIPVLSASSDLQRSFSALYPRARLNRGNQQIAAMACANPEDEAGLLTFALIWFDHVCTRARSDTRTSLCLFLPENSGTLTAHRLRWLDTEPLKPRVFRFNVHGSAGEVDPQDLGNIHTSVRGSGTKFEIAPSSAGPGDRDERWLEACLRRDISPIDSTLRQTPIHEQVLSFAAIDRDLIDLLAVDVGGRLAVLELKVSEDLHLPIQALDYWIRVSWHAERGELVHLFPSIPLVDQKPKLFLVAPAMAFHSANRTVLRYFSPTIEVERVGINSDWQQHLRVVLRLRGAADPISHENS